MKPRLPNRAPSTAPRDTLLVLVPGDPGAPVDWWRLGPDGAVLEDGRGRAVPAQSAVAGRVVVGIGGCGVHWVELRAHSMAQAAAAARAALAAEVASGDEGLHVAVAPAGKDRWLAAVTASADLERGLVRVRELGLEPEQVVPAALLLPPPATLADGTADPVVQVFAHQGNWLCRGEELAFVAEAPLARTILGDRPVHVRTLEGAAFAAAAVSPPLNLLQGPFAPAGSAPQGAAAWRRAMVLGALVVAVLLLAPGLRAGLDQWQATRLQARATAEAHAALPSLAADEDALAALRARLAASRNVGDFSAAVAGLMAAVDAVPGASLDAMSWRDGRLQATVGHGGQADVDALRAQLDTHGFLLVEEGSANEAGTPHLRLSMEPTR